MRQVSLQLRARYVLCIMRAGAAAASPRGDSSLGAMVASVAADQGVRTAADGDAAQMSAADRYAAACAPQELALTGRLLVLATDDQHRHCCGKRHVLQTHDRAHAPCSSLSPSALPDVWRVGIAIDLCHAITKPRLPCRAFEEAQDCMLNDFRAFTAGATCGGSSAPHITALKVQPERPPCCC